jgi:hypothetical protein
MAPRGSRPRCCRADRQPGKAEDLVVDHTTHCHHRGDGGDRTAKVTIQVPSRSVPAGQSLGPVFARAPNGIMAGIWYGYVTDAVVAQRQSCRSGRADHSSGDLNSYPPRRKVTEAADSIPCLRRPAAIGIAPTPFKYSGTLIRLARGMAKTPWLPSVVATTFCGT